MAGALRKTMLYLGLADDRGEHEQYVDEYDAVCDHLLVIDHAATEAKPFRKPRPKVVGTYRLLRQDVAERHADDDAEPDPDGEVSLEDGHATRLPVSERWRRPSRRTPGCPSPPPWGSRTGGPA